ncbi:MAG: beta-ketoacyl-ACP synthase II [Syntrophales bacterium]|nr:beta-ketoacyl-ACP synthase II [Syntrophales bacterium]
MKRRVVVTGMGAVTPLGNSVEESWVAACSGKSGIGPLTKFDCQNFETRIAGELKNFDPLKHVTKKELRRYDDFIIYALAAADMAVDHARLKLSSKECNRAGVIIGSAIGGLSTMEDAKERILSGGPNKMSPFDVPAVLANLAAGHVSIRFNLKGPIACPVAACASGTYGIGDAFRMIQYGYADVMIAGGVDAAITPLSVGGFNAMRALSRKNNEPERASRPFDRDRDGFVIAEGAALLVLEELNHALERGATIYAEIVGYAITSDAYHMVAPPEGHEGAARCMEAALVDAELTREDIDYINAHGTSTPLNDLYEVQAIRRVFGDHIHKISISSTKSMTGHMLGAAGGVEAIFCVMAIKEEIIPPTINLFNPDPDMMDLDFVPHKAKKKEVRAAMSNSFGFGGTNAVLIFKKFKS